MRLGRLEQSILSLMLKSGATTNHELSRQMWNLEMYCGGKRGKALYRSIKQLRKKGLIVAKPYYKHVVSGFTLRKTISYAISCDSNRSNYHIYGLTPEGKKQILKRTQVRKWMFFLPFSQLCDCLVTTTQSYISPLDMLRNRFSGFREMFCDASFGP